MSENHILIVNQPTTRVVEVDDNEVHIINRDVTRIVEVGRLGPQGIQGEAGSSDGVYVHEQTVPSNSWVINHNLGYFPSVTVVDHLNREMIVGVTYTDENTLTVISNPIFSGKAFLS